MEPSAPNKPGHLTPGTRRVRAIHYAFSVEDLAGYVAQKARGGRYYLEALVGDLTKPRIDESGPTGPWFYFMHIEKTAGTSLLYSLYRSYRQARVFPNMHQERKYFLGRYPLWAELDDHCQEWLPRDLEMLVGHFGMDPIDRFAIKPKVFTFLRDPVERLISAIEFNRKPGARYGSMTFQQVLDAHGSIDGTQQARTFGYDHERNNLDEMLENFEKVDFVGFVDTYDSCLGRLSAFLELDEPLVSEKKNVGRKFVPSDQQRKQLERVTEPDRVLYEFAKQQHPTPAVPV